MLSGSSPLTSRRFRLHLSMLGHSPTKASLAAMGVATASFVGAAVVSPSSATPDTEATATSDSALRYDPAAPGFKWATSHFPTNARGLTYGSVATAQTPAQMPDLIAATGINGVSGFLRKSDYLTSEPDIKSPGEAVAWEKRLDDGFVLRIPVYDISGLNQIDTFQFSPTRDAE